MASERTNGIRLEEHISSTASGKIQNSFSSITYQAGSHETIRQSTEQGRCMF